MDSHGRTEAGILINIISYALFKYELSDTTNKKCYWCRLIKVSQHFNLILISNKFLSKNNLQNFRNFDIRE